MSENDRASVLKRNLKYAKHKGPYITTLGSDEEESSFRNWVLENRVPFDLKDENPDYDMRGYYKSLKDGVAENPSVNASDGQLHYPDTYKTPYHESFSNESVYANKKAPKWVGDDNTGWMLQGDDGVIYKDERIKK